MADPLLCWRCGASLAALPLPLGRRDECPDCVAELHVCKMCRYYDAQVPKACREDDAEEVKEKERANFCDYFKPSANAYVPGFRAASAKAENQLASLFGDEPAERGTPMSGEEIPEDDDPQRALEDLFKP